MAIRVRPVAEGDVAAMAAIRAQEWETVAYWQTRIGRYLSGELSPRQALAVRAAFVAEDDGTVVGFVAGHRTRRYGCDGELEWITVADEHRGRGIAATLLETMAEWFVQRQAHRICVNVEPKNAVARGLYAKYGAQRLSDYWMVWQDVRTIGAPSKMGTRSKDVS